MIRKLESLIEKLDCEGEYSNGYCQEDIEDIEEQVEELKKEMSKIEDLFECIECFIQYEKGIDDVHYKLKVYDDDLNFVCETDNINSSSPMSMWLCGVQVEDESEDEE